jgi:hypothetical protein
MVIRTRSSGMWHHAVWQHVPMLERTCCLLLQHFLLPWQRRQQSPSTRWHKSTKQHGVIIQKTIIFTINCGSSERKWTVHVLKTGGWFNSCHLILCNRHPLSCFNPTIYKLTSTRYIIPKICMIQMNIKLLWTSREQHTGIQVLKCNFSIKLDQAQIVIRWCLRIGPFSKEYPYF